MIRHAALAALLAIALAVGHARAVPNALSSAQSPLGTLNAVIDCGADPTGIADSAPALRRCMRSGYRTLLPGVTFAGAPARYRLASTVAAPCCAYDPEALSIRNLTNFTLSGYGATLVVDPAIALSGALVVDGSSHFVIEGVTIQGTRSGLAANQENGALGFSNDVDFIVRDVHVASGFNGNGAAIGGDWWVGARFDHIQMDGVGHCFDIAYVQHLSISRVIATGLDATGALPGQTCLSVITDPPNVGQNATGFTYTSSADILIEALDESNFNTGGFFSTGTGYTLVGNHWHNNPGSAGAHGLGIWFQNDASASADANGNAPPGNIAITGDKFDANGTAVAGDDIVLSAATAASGAVMAGITITGCEFSGAANLPILADGTAGFARVTFVGNQFNGSTPNANAISVADVAQIGSAVTIGGALVAKGAVALSSTLSLPNNVALNMADGTGTGHAILFASPSNELVMRGLSSTGDISLQDFNGNAVLQAFPNGVNVSQPVHATAVPACSATSPGAHTLCTTPAGSTAVPLGMMP